jgi:hypothetical protein
MLITLSTDLAIAGAMDILTALNNPLDVSTFAPLDNSEV